jgi:hypothetical protein
MHGAGEVEIAHFQFLVGWLDTPWQGFGARFELAGDPLGALR